MALDLEAIRRTFVQQMEQWLELLPDEARQQTFVAIAGGEDLSPEQMVAQVKRGTEWGNRLLESAIALSASRQMQQMLASEHLGRDSMTEEEGSRPDHGHHHRAYHGGSRSELKGGATTFAPRTSPSIKKYDDDR